MASIEEGLSRFFSRSERESLGQRAKDEIESIGSKVMYPEENLEDTSRVIYAVESFRRAFPLVDVRGEARYREAGKPDEETANLHMHVGEGPLVMYADTVAPERITHYELWRIPGGIWDEDTRTFMTVQPSQESGESVTTLYTFESDPSPDGQPFRRLAKSESFRASALDGEPVTERVVRHEGAWVRADEALQIADRQTYATVMKDDDLGLVMYAFNWESTPRT